MQPITRAEYNKTHKELRPEHAPPHTFGDHKEPNVESPRPEAPVDAESKERSSRRKG